MRVRTLITQRLYFGVDALHLRAATGRVVARVVGLPPERARVSARNLCQDFGFDALRGQALIDELLAEGLLEAPDELQADYGLTERFLEFAAARVVEPLPRERAKQLLLRACALAAQVNAEWTQQSARSRGDCAVRQLHDPRHAARRAVHRHRGAAARRATAARAGAG